jgi:hypothetical protein
MRRMEFLKVFATRRPENLSLCRLRRCQDQRAGELMARFDIVMGFTPET